MEQISRSDKFTIKQKKEMVEILANWEANNRYEVYNESGMIFHALEQTDCCKRYWCGPLRAFHIKFVEGVNTCFLEMTSDCDCFGRTVEVQSPPGNKLGTIVKPFAWCRPTFSLRDYSGNQRFCIPTPWGACCCKCCEDVEIPVLDNTGNEVACIRKKWGGFCKEWCTDADTFDLDFRYGADVAPADKLLILASVFPIDFAFFERGRRRQNNNNQ